MDNTNERKEVVDSHSSALTNARVIMNMVEIDKARLIAARTKNIEDINFYYEAIDGLRVCFLNIFPNYEKIIEAKKVYDSLYYNILIYDSFKTYRNLLGLFILAKKYNEEISAGLNYLGYQFRTSKEEFRGLGEVEKFKNHSIFRNKRKVAYEQDKSDMDDL